MFARCGLESSWAGGDAEQGCAAAAAGGPPGWAFRASVCGGAKGESELQCS